MVKTDEKNEQKMLFEDLKTHFKSYLLNQKFYKSPTTQVANFETGSPLFAFLLFQDLIAEQDEKKVKTNLKKYRHSYQNFFLKRQARRKII